MDHTFTLFIDFNQKLKGIMVNFQLILLELSIESERHEVDSNLDWTPTPNIPPCNKAVFFCFLCLLLCCDKRCWNFSILWEISLWRCGRCSLIGEENHFLSVRFVIVLSSWLIIHAFLQGGQLLGCGTDMSKGELAGKCLIDAKEREKHSVFYRWMIGLVPWTVKSGHTEGEQLPSHLPVQINTKNCLR